MAKKKVKTEVATRVGPTKTFKFPKQFKRIMATIVNKVDRDAYKNISIGAQLRSLEKMETKKSANIVEAEDQLA